MRKFLINLMVVLSLGLCLLIWFQWLREGRTRGELQRITDERQNYQERLLATEANLKNIQAEISRLDALKKEFQEQVKTNVAYQFSLMSTNDLLRREVDVRGKQIDAYKAAMDQANDAIKRQNEDVKRQNDDMKKLIEERNEIAEKLNHAVTQYNELAEKWNKLNTELAAQHTNAPAAK